MVDNLNHTRARVSRQRDPFERAYRVVLTLLCALFLLNWHLARAQDPDVALIDQELATIESAFQPDVETRVVVEPAPTPDLPRALLKARREATISSLIAARIQKIHVEDGQRFEAGDSLVTFECSVSSARLESIKARLKQYRYIYEANVELYKNNGVSKLDLAISRAKMEEGESEVTLAIAQLEKCSVYAPYSGRVVKVIANEHESASIGSALLVILDDQQPKVILHAPSDQITSLAVGQRFAVAVDETKTDYEAVITAVIPVIDPSSRTVEIIADIVGKHPELLAGMSGNATFHENE